jgi:CHAD domain-containing protein
MSRIRKKAAHSVFVLNLDHAIEDFIADLNRRTEVEVEKPVESHRIYYDSFDWRLLNQRMELYHEPQAKPPQLIWTSQRQEIPRMTLPCVETVPEFIGRFPHGAMQSLLAPLLEMRALLPRLELLRREKMLRLLDDERKTVVRVRLEEDRLIAVDGREIDPLPLSTRVELVPLRGYQEELARVRGYCAKQSCLSPLDKPLMVEAMDRLDGSLRLYSSKLKFRFRPEQTAHSALVEICQFLLGVISENLEGVIADIDSEFLHDLRVAIRRTRSALGQLRDIFPEKESEQFQERFAWLGAITGPTRDLDVYLLGFDEYRQSLPERFRADLEPLKAFLKRHQAQEQQQLVEQLGSHEFVNLMDDWSDFLEAQVSAAGEEGSSLGSVASRRVLKIWEKVLQEGGAIDVASPPEALHDLRKRCKKLRYLLEFVGSAFDADQINTLVKEIKRLLDTLGDYQDLEVQADKLREFAHLMIEEGETPADTLLAMGMLVDDLLRRQGQKRDEFFGRFADFSRKENRQLVERLFRAQAEGKAG